MRRVLRKLFAWVPVLGAALGLSLGATTEHCDSVTVVEAHSPICQTWAEILHSEHEPIAPEPTKVLTGNHTRGSADRNGTGPLPAGGPRIWSDGA